MSRTLLIVTCHFPPSAASGAFRMLGFARHLPKFGWTVHVVSPPQMPLEPVDHELDRQVPSETVRYARPFPSGRLARWCGRLLKVTGTVGYQAVWVPAAIRACSRAIRSAPPDALLTSGPPHSVHLAGLILKRQFRLPWIADFRDPWFSTGNPARRHVKARRINRRLEAAVVRNADAIVANAPRACQALQAAYPSVADRIVTITNGFDPDSFRLATREPHANGACKLLHAGEIYAGRDPRPFLDAIQEIDVARPADRKSVRVRLVGLRGKEYEDLEHELRRRGLDSTVSLEGHVPYVQCLQEMTEADLLVLFDRPGRRVGVPAKLYEYMGAGRPILALAEDDGDTAWVLEHCHVPHRIVSPKDPSAIRSAVLELAQGSNGAAANAESHAPDPRFTREAGARRLAAILDAQV